MFCRNCGTQVSDNAVMCPQCRTILDPRFSGQADGPAQGTASPPGDYEGTQANIKPKTSSRNGLAVSSLVLSIVGLVTMPFYLFVPDVESLISPCILPGLAIIFGALSLKSERRPFALAGFIMGIVGLGLLILCFTGLFIILAVMLGALLISL